jgi:hypothetical protein
MSKKRKNKPGIKTGLLYWVTKTGPYSNDSVAFWGISPFPGGLFRDGLSRYEGKFKTIAQAEFLFAAGYFGRARSPRFGFFPICWFDDLGKREEFLNLTTPFLLCGDTSARLVLNGTFELFPTGFMDGYYPAGKGNYFIAGEKWSGFVLASEKKEGTYQLQTLIFSSEAELRIQGCQCFDYQGRPLGEISQILDAEALPGPPHSVNVELVKSAPE